MCVSYTQTTTESGNSVEFQTKAMKMKYALCLIATFTLGYWLGLYLANFSSSVTPEPQPFSDETCPGKCVSAVALIRTLWPSTEMIFKTTRIIPQTQLACERICAARDVKNLVAG